MLTILRKRLILLIVFCLWIIIIRIIEDLKKYSEKPSWLSTFIKLSIRFNREVDQRSTYRLHNSICNEALFKTYKFLVQVNEKLETSIECIGSLYNRSCLYKNLYYKDKIFWILTTKKIPYQLPNVRIGAWIISYLSPNRRRFYSYEDLHQFVRHDVNPIVVPNLTVYFDQPWISNIGHALFDGLYPAYVALIRFPPRHLQPFHILLSTDNDHDNNKSYFSQDVYNHFAGLGIINLTILENISIGKWIAFQELVMGSGNLCQRCLQPNLQLPGGVQLNGSRLFRDRMYQQYGLISPTTKQDHSTQRHDINKPLKAYVIDNKRFTSQDKIAINGAIDEINSYTDIYRHQTIDNRTKFEWPLIHVSYISYPLITLRNDGSLQLNTTETEAKMSSNRNKMNAHLQLLQDMHIHIAGPGTGQMYQTFLSDGSIHINLGGLGTRKRNNTIEQYTSFMEQPITAGIPYIKALYYPINQRTKGIQKDILIILIREAAQFIIQGFSIPVNPIENFAPDGQLFIEMCQLDKNFCRAVTDRWQQNNFWCTDTWIEDIVFEKGLWSLEGINIDGNNNLTCPYNRTLLHQLRHKYNINFII